MLLAAAYFSPAEHRALFGLDLKIASGEVATLHVKPSREVKPGGDLTAEFCVAPSLQYLPVRIVIRQDDETYVDLVIERLPLQAEPGR